MEPLDWDALKENCAGDDSLVKEVLELFRSEAASLLADVGQAVVSKDAVAIRRSAHRLKGALVSLAAKPATEAAKALESAGAQGDVSGSDGMFETLKTEMERLLKVIPV